jgi:CheY-like chemotaxis protein
MATVLVVEDDLHCRENLSKALRIARHTVVAAKDAETGVALAALLQPDVVMLDVRLPLMNGFDAADSMECLQPDLRFVIMTGYPIPDDKIHVLSRANYWYLSKPFRLPAAIQAVEHALSRTRPWDPVAVGSQPQPPPAHRGLPPDVPSFRTPLSPGTTPVPLPFASPSARRLARAIVGVSDLESDVRTLAEWGKAIAASRGSVRGWCHAAGVQPKSALAFARALRAYRLASKWHLPPTDVLDFADKRTAERFLSRVDTFPCSYSSTATLEEFCASQSYLRARPVVGEVMALLRQKP